MTLGMKISFYRKELGLSQEALGEKLGVSRQAISKWEADAAIPEIDKLIALSKLFSVPVGQLLGVEDPPPETAPAAEAPADSGELTEKQEQMIEEIVSRYVAAMPKPKRMSIGRKLALAAAVVIVAGWYIVSINDRISSMQNSLSNQISNIQGSTSSQINSISTRLEEIMEQGTSILIDSAAYLSDYDPERDVYTFYVSASPKEVWEDSVCTFWVTNVEDPSSYVTLTVETDQAGTYAGKVDWPASYGNGVNISVTFTEGNYSRQEGITTISGLYSYGRPTCIIHSSDATVIQQEDLTLTLDWGYMDFFLADEVDYDYDDYALPPPYLEFFLNGELLGTHEIDMTQYSNESLLLQPTTLTFPLTEQISTGDRMGVFLHLTDQYGRECRVFAFWAELNSTGSTHLYESWDPPGDLPIASVSGSGLYALSDELIDLYADGNKDILHVGML